MNLKEIKEALEEGRNVEIKMQISRIIKKFDGEQMKKTPVVNLCPSYIHKHAHTHNPTCIYIYTHIHPCKYVHTPYTYMHNFT